MTSSMKESEPSYMNSFLQLVSNYGIFIPLPGENDNSFMLLIFQMCDSLELLLLSVLAPTIHCIWHLSSWEEAFITTVSVLIMPYPTFFAAT